MQTLLAAVTVDNTAAVDPAPILLGSLVGYLLTSLGLMGVFAKAGEAGWQGFVPIWNTLVLLKVAGRPLWWFLLLLVPFVNIVVIVLLMYALSQSFGHGGGFAVGLVLLSTLFLWILWLGSSTYRGPAGSPALAP